MRHPFGDFGVCHVCRTPLEGGHCPECESRFALVVAFIFSILTMIALGVAYAYP